MPGAREASGGLRIRVRGFKLLGAPLKFLTQYRKSLRASLRGRLNPYVFPYLWSRRQRTNAPWEVIHQPVCDGATERSECTGDDGLADHDVPGADLVSHAEDRTGDLARRHGELAYKLGYKRPNQGPTPSTATRGWSLVVAQPHAVRLATMGASGRPRHHDDGYSPAQTRRRLLKLLPCSERMFATLDRAPRASSRV